jgi:hypothetical protein
LVITYIKWVIRRAKNKLKQKKMTTTKNNNGTITISDIVNNQYIKQTYIGYSIKEAKKRFKKFVSVNTI